jgi:hypothetical protein
LANTIPNSDFGNCVEFEFQYFVKFVLSNVIPKFEIVLVGLVANDQRHTMVVVAFQK